MKAFICNKKIFGGIDIGDICYYVKKTTIFDMKDVVVILYNNEHYYSIESEFYKSFTPRNKNRKEKLDKLNKL